MSPSLAYPESIGIGLLQGVTELFPVSSLGHAVLVPALIGGRTRHDLDVTAGDSPYPAVLVGHFRRDWIRTVGGLFSSPTRREIATPEQKLARLLVLSTVPVGTAGPALDHLLRDALGKPNPAAFFLALNGLVLYTAERLKRGGTGRRRAADGPLPADSPAAFLAGYASVRFLTRYFETRSLTPFAAHCALAGLGCPVYLNV